VPFELLDADPPVIHWRVLRVALPLGLLPI
jgi:hypothetical protein